jgi:hypothetical protein
LIYFLIFFVFLSSATLAQEDFLRGVFILRCERSEPRRPHNGCVQLP